MILDQLVSVETFAKEKNIPIEVAISRIEEETYTGFKNDNGKWFVIDPKVLEKLEMQLDEEVNKFNSDYYHIDDICNQMLSNKGLTTNLIKKIFFYLDIGVIEGISNKKELEEHQKSPYHVLKNKNLNTNIIDILFLNYMPQFPEAFFIINKVLLNGKYEQKFEVVRALNNLNFLQEVYSEDCEKSINELKKIIIPKFSFLNFFSKKMKREEAERVFFGEISRMETHLKAKYQLYSIVDELLINFEVLPSFSLFNKYDYSRIVYVKKDFCAKLQGKPEVMESFNSKSFDKIVDGFVSHRAGFFARLIYPHFYRSLWVEKVSTVLNDINSYILNK